MSENFTVKISIVIPTYNNLVSFKRALGSVFIQKFEDYEIIVTDDSNNDEIGLFIKYLYNDKVKYFKNETPLGSPENWNGGLRKAKGKYIKILHHDDWFADENSLEKFVKLMDENPQSDFGYAKSVDVDTETGKIKTRKAEKYVKQLKKDPFELFITNRIGAPSVTVFRNNKNFFFDKNLKWVVDMEFYINCLRKNPNIAFLNEVLINIGISSSQITKICQDDTKIQIFEQFCLYNKYKDQLQAKKYQNALVDLVKEFKIKDLDKLKEMLPENIEIPEKVKKACSKKFFPF